MRVDDVVVLAGMTAAVGVAVVRDAEGPHLWLLGMAAGAVAWLVAKKRRAALAPDPAVPRPGVLVVARDDASTVRQVVETAERTGLAVWVVDDGSEDATAEIARQAGARVLAHPRRFGHGAAFLAGLRAMARAGHTHAIRLEGDGRYAPEAVPAFLDALAEEPLALIQGVPVGGAVAMDAPMARFEATMTPIAAAGGEARGSASGARMAPSAPTSPAHRGGISSLLVRAETGRWIADAGCRLRAWPIAPVLDLAPEGGGEETELELLVRLVWAGVPVRELACAEREVPTLAATSPRVWWTHALLLSGRLLWPPRWFPRVRGRPARRPALGRAMVRAVGRAPAAFFATVAATAWVLTDGRARRALGGYASRALPRTPRLLGALRIARERARLQVDLAARAHVVEEGTEGLAAALAAGEGAILLTPSLGALDPGLAALGAIDRIRTVRLEDGTRPLGPPFPAIPVDPGEGYASFAVVRALKDGAVIVLPGDRLVDDRTVTVDLLGAPALVPAGPWVAAALARVPVIPVACLREGPGQWRLVAGRPMRCTLDRASPRDAQLRAWAQEWAGVVGDWMRAWPEQYGGAKDPWSARPPEGAGSGA